MRKHGFMHDFLKGGAWALLIRFFTVISNLVISMLIARMLTPGQVGSYFLIVSILSVISVVSLLGLNVAIVRIIAKSVTHEEKGKLKSAITKTLILSLVSASILAAILYVTGLEFISVNLFHDKAIYDYKLLISVLVVLWSLESINVEVFRGFKKFHLAVLFKRLAPNLMIIILSLYYFLSNVDVNLNDYLYIVVIGWLLSLLLSAYFIKTVIPKNVEKYKASIRSLLDVSLPLWVSNTITIALTQIDLWILAIYRPPEEVALYGIASRLSQFLSLPLLMIQSVIAPLIAEAHALERKNELSRGIQTVSAIAFIPGFIACCIFIVFGESLITMIFGNHYGEASSILSILLFGMIFKLFAGSGQTLLNMTGHEKSSMIISLTIGFLMVFGCLYAGEHYGMIGIAIVTASAMCLSGVLNIIISRLQVGIWAIPIIRVSQIKRYIAKK